MRAFGILLLLIWGLLTAFSLVRYPAPLPDEVWFTAIAREFLLKRSFGLPIFSDIYGSSRNFVTFGRINIVIMAGIFRVFGVGPVPAQSLSALGALIGAWFLSRSGTRLYGVVGGGMVGGVFLFSWNVFFASHFARPEMLVVAGGAAALYLYLCAREAERVCHFFWLGLLCGVLLDLHFSFLHYLIVILVLVLFDPALAVRDWRRICALGAGLGVGVGYWLVAHFYPDPLLAVQQWRFGPHAKVLAAGTTSGGARLEYAVRFFKDQFLTNTRLSFLQALYWAAAIGLLAWKRERRNMWILLTVASLTLTTTILLPSIFHTYYAVMLVPVFSVALVAAAVSASTALPVMRMAQLRVPSAEYMPAFLIAPLLLIYLVGDVSLYWRNRGVDYQTYAEKLMVIIPLDANVLGEGIWWYTFNRGLFTGDGELERLENQSEALMLAELTEIFQGRQVEYVLSDEGLDVGRIADSTVQQVFERYVATTCAFVGTVEGELYGVERGGPRNKVTKIYRCRPIQ